MRQEFKYGSLCGEIRCITSAKNNLRGRSSKLGARTRTAHTHFSTSKRVYNPGDGRSRAIVRSSALRSRARYTRRGSGGLRSRYSLLLLLLFPLRPNATRHRRLPQLTVTPHSPFSTLEAPELGRWPGPWLSSLLGRTVCRNADVLTATTTIWRSTNARSLHAADVAGSHAQACSELHNPDAWQWPHARARSTPAGRPLGW